MYKVFWPRGQKITKVAPLAKRLNTLKYKTICELWDWVFRGDEIFAILETMLRDRYPGIKIVSYNEFGNIHGSEEGKFIAALPADLNRYGCDAVLSAVGC